MPARSGVGEDGPSSGLQITFLYPYRAYPNRAAGGMGEPFHLPFMRSLIHS